jgi:hypothetical protein
VVVELQERLLSQKRELDSREGAIATWDEGLVAFARVLGKARTKCDTSHVHADTVQWDFFA